MDYKEYTKKYCDNCINKDCTRIPVNNDGSLINKENPNICRYFKKRADLEIVVEKLEEVFKIVSGYVENYDEKCEAIDKAISLLKYIGENDLIRRDDVYNFLEFECSNLKEAIDSLYELNKVDLDFLERTDIYEQQEDFKES